MDKILLTAKINPDLDGLATAYAYQKLLAKQGKDAEAVIYGRPHVEAEYVIDRFVITDILYRSKEKYKSFILCDASSLIGLPHIIRPEDVIEVIDHRESDATKDFPDAILHIEFVGAAATLIVEKYIAMKESIDNASAVLLYGAIFSNTLNLKGSVTTTRDRDAVTWLEKQMKIPADYISEMFRIKTLEIEKSFRETFVNDSKEFPIKGFRIGISQLELSNSDKIILEYKGEIFSLLKELQKEHALSFNFLSIVDMEKGNNFFITDDPQMQKILEDVLSVIFTDNIATYGELILRKQLVPLLKKNL